MARLLRATPSGFGWIALAAIFGCLGFAAPAQAAITTTHVSSPLDSTFYNPVVVPDDLSTLTVSGTTDSSAPGTDKVDIHCLYQSNGGPQVSVPLTTGAANVSLDGSGNFSTQLKLRELGFYACRLIATPAGLGGTYDTNVFQGHRIGVGWTELKTVSGGPNNGAIQDLYQAASPFGGYWDGYSVGRCFMNSLYMTNPGSALLDYLPALFGCSGVYDAPDPPTDEVSYAGLTVDGNKSYLPWVARGIPLSALPDQLPGYRGIEGYSRNFDPSNGTVTIDSDEPAVHCGGFPPSNANCASFSSSHLHAVQHTAVEHNGRSVVYDQKWVNSSSGTREVDVYYGVKMNLSAGYKFPGQVSFAARAAGDASGDEFPVPPAGAGTLKIIGDPAGSPCAFTADDQCGSLTWSKAPNDIVFTDDDQFWMHFVFSVPEGCALPIHLGYTLSDSQAGQDALVAELESRFAGSALTCQAANSPSSPNSPGASPASNKFSISAKKPKAGAKKISFSVDVPGSGDLDAALTTKTKLSKSSTLGKTHLKVDKAGKRKVTIKLTKKARKTLRKKRKLNTTLTVKFSPTGGTPASQSAKLKLRR